jgi:hypothetical protein
MSVRLEAWPEAAYVSLVDAGPCTLAIVRRRDVADPVDDELITLAQGSQPTGASSSQRLPSGSISTVIRLSP